MRIKNLLLSLALILTITASSYASVMMLQTQAAGVSAGYPLTSLSVNNTNHSVYVTFPAWQFTALSIRLEGMMSPASQYPPTTGYVRMQAADYACTNVDLANGYALFPISAIPVDYVRVNVTSVTNGTTTATATGLVQSFATAISTGTATGTLTTTTIATSTTIGTSTYSGTSTNTVTTIGSYTGTSTATATGTGTWTGAAVGTVLSTSTAQTTATATGTGASTTYTNYSTATASSSNTTTATAITTGSGTSTAYYVTGR